MSRTYRRCIWDCRTEWERNENGHLINKSEPPNYRVRVPDKWAFTHNREDAPYEAKLRHDDDLAYAEEQIRHALKGKDY